MFKKKPNNNQPRRTAMILDTCALIDGRIIAIAKAGFVPQQLIVPQFVIAELQYLADNGDSQKRERARFGLDVIRDLQDMRRIEVVIAREQFSNIKEVDDKLVALAKQYGASLYTTDYNLNKVAQIEGVVVLNVNELAQALRPPRLPGEQVEIKITQIGQDKTQGVGYLEDGTMVDVERAAHLMGQKARVEFSRILQTQAGKMMFAVLLPGQGQPQSSHHGGGRPNPAQAEQRRPQPQQQTRPPVMAAPAQAPVSAQQAPVPTPRPVDQQRPQQPHGQPHNQNAGRPARRQAPRRRLSPEDKLLNALNSQPQ